MSAAATIRPLGDTPFERLMDLRVAMFAEDGLLAPDQADTLRAAQARWQHEHAHSCAHWLAWVGENAVGCASLAWFPRMPYPGHDAGLEAYLLNVYVQPAWRRRGLAGQLVEAALAAARGRGVAKVWLHASPAGRAMYLARGFAPAGTYLEWWPG
jgi:GNAT superfamily N-acetyltransferase